MLPAQDYGELLKNATIDTIVPRISNLDIEETLSQPSEDEPSNAFGILPSIAQRQLLFFGERFL
jgi:hypothetical protein